MKFKIERASNREVNLPNTNVEKDKYGKEIHTIELNTLEELFALCDETDENVIVSYRSRWKNIILPTITIYDGYIE